MSSVNASISVILIVVALINNAAPSQGPETSHGIPCKRVQCKENEEFACDSSGTKNPYYSTPTSRGYTPVKNIAVNNIQMISVE